MRKTLILFLFLLTTDIYSKTLVLMYHALSPRPISNTSINPTYFRNHIRELKEEGFRIITLREALPIFKDGDYSDSLFAIITFDDGWGSVYKHGFPIIKEENVPIVLFLFPRVIDKEPGYMGWNEIREMLASGLVEIGSHGLSHAPLECKSFKSRLHCAWFMQSELQLSRDILSMNTGQAIFSIAFPFGIHDAMADEMIRKYGYEMAFTIENPILTPYKGRFHIPRLDVSRRDESIGGYIRRFINNRKPN